MVSLEILTKFCRVLIKIINEMQFIIKLLILSSGIGHSPTYIGFRWVLKFKFIILYPKNENVFYYMYVFHGNGTIKAITDN